MSAITDSERLAVLLIQHELNLIAVRAELVEAQESAHISTSSMRTDSRTITAESISKLYYHILPASFKLLQDSARLPPLPNVK